MLPLFISIQRLNQVDSGPNTEKAPEEESQVSRGYGQSVPTCLSKRTGALEQPPHTLVGDDQACRYRRQEGTWVWHGW